MLITQKKLAQELNCNINTLNRYLCRYEKVEHYRINRHTVYANVTDEIKAELMTLIHRPRAKGMI